MPRILVVGGNGFLGSHLVDALARNDVLQVLFFAVLFGASLALVGGEKARAVSDLIDALATAERAEQLRLSEQ